MANPQDPRGTGRSDETERVQPLKRPAGSDREGARGGLGPAIDVHREESESDYASLAASLHGTWGNTLVQAALAGHEEGPAEIIHGAMTLGASGMAVPEASESLFTNSFVNGWISEHGNGEADVATAPVMRRAQTESFESGAASKLERARARRGTPLEQGTRQQLEQAFGGVDFSGVRLHTDATAREASRAIRAEAYTVGQDIYFDEANFDPNSARGQHLLAHELTHVVQHQEGRLRAVGDGLKVSAPTDVVEQEAERIAHQVVGELDLSGSASAEAPAVDAADAAPAAPAASQGEGVFRRRRPGAGSGGPTRPKDPRALKMKADVKARDRRRGARVEGPKRGGGRRMPEARRERFKELLSEHMRGRGAEILSVLGWGVPTQADAEKPKQKGAAGPEGVVAKGYANWKKQYKEDSRTVLEQRSSAMEDLFDFLDDVVESWSALSVQMLGHIGHEQAWQQFTETLEGKDQQGANEGPGETDGDNQENQAHDGLQGHFDANHHKAKRHGDGKSALSTTVGSFDSGGDSASGQDDVLKGEEKLAGGGDQDGSTPRMLDVRKSLDTLVDEANRFASEFMTEVDGNDITEGTQHGGELAAAQANVSAGGGVRDEDGSAKPRIDKRRQVVVDGSATALFSKPGARNVDNETGRLPPGSTLQASSDDSRPGWTHVTVTEGPLTGQTGWVQSGAISDVDLPAEHGTVSSEDLVRTIDVLLNQGQGGLRQAGELLRDPRQALLRMAGGSMPGAVKDALGGAFGWMEH